jgi:hypothetical protein
MDMLAAAQKEYRDDEVRVDVLNIFVPGNAYLQRLVAKFTTMCHYQINKFGNPSEEDFKILKDEIEAMIGKAQEIMLSRSQSNYAT